ncbi:hypothetical protein TNCV_3075721 [Trichonephila clavipes]|nr:hypothetical protein TNCV_3075721 [Trichonephila clavipes]
MANFSAASGRSLASAGGLGMPKVLTLKATDSEYMVLRKIEVCYLNGWGKIRRIEGQDVVLCIKHLPIPPYGYSPDCAYFLVSHIF